MRHHQRQSTNFNRQNLALLLDPYNNAGVSSASNPNYIDHQNMLGLNEATMVDHQEEPIFVPHREKVRIMYLDFRYFKFLTAKYLGSKDFYTFSICFALFQNSYTKYFIYV